ncbi:hypothetical protein E1301_Tti006177 [Triplophysa tibetana]|uniref:Uncharacterized protein n=1 Tax=Triplophysa tibetana TaxID=1572043 RepID=A0A5A9NN94_9TELE|nr:hypothetical protein E1301_Tti006177 [Triplophysa tibetana]
MNISNSLAFEMRAVHVQAQTGAQRFATVTRLNVMFPGNSLQRLEPQGWLAWASSQMSRKSATQGDESPSSDEQPSEEEDEDNSSQKKTVREKKAAEPSQDPTDNAPDKDDDAETEDHTQDQEDTCSEFKW